MCNSVEHAVHKHWSIFDCTNIACLPYRLASAFVLDQCSEYLWYTVLEYCLLSVIYTEPCAHTTLNGQPTPTVRDSIITARFSQANTESIALMEKQSLYITSKDILI